jgi:dienelactone hydrolase
MRALISAFAMVLLVSVTKSPAFSDDLYPHEIPAGGPDLNFPSTPQPFGFAKANKMFKPAGDGSFPGLVILPTCGGHNWRHSFDIWAKAALDRGYAVLVVDPLTPRGVVTPGENCGAPAKISGSRYRKDAFDAAEHLRTQPFVDRERIGLLGLSLGAMAGLGAAAEFYARPQGRSAFRAIVSIYPICFIANLRLPSRKNPANIHWLPYNITIPLQVQLGELDTEAPPKDCVPLLREQKEKGAPIEIVVHKDATHNWDALELQKRAFRKKGLLGQDIVYRYNPKVTMESVRQAFDFLDRHVNAK